MRKSRQRACSYYIGGFLFFTIILGSSKPSTAQLVDPLIVQTNAAGDNIHLIDPTSNTIVGEISGIEVNHGITAAPDGSYFYVTNEVDHTLDIVDAKNLQISHKVPLSGRPNNVAIRHDGARVYVAIVSSPGAVDVIDAASATLATSINTAGGVHNTFTTPDGKYVVAGSIAGRNLTVIDSETETAVWSLFFDAGVRPMSFETNPDGSTSRIFVQLSNFHGFATVDFEERREVGQRIELPSVPEDERHSEFLQGSPSHGQGVTPDGTSLWLCSKVNSFVYAYSLPDLNYLGGVHVGSHPDWLTFSPDSQYVYVANAGSNSTSVVNIETMTEVTQIPVGQVPKRVITAQIPRTSIENWTARQSGALSLASREPFDYDFYRDEVEPIFVRKRIGIARCVVCHSTRTRFRLQPLPADGEGWTAEQSQRNLSVTRRMIRPNDLMASPLLTLPLSEKSGGNPFHPGGKHWTSQSDPEWQTIVRWIQGTQD
jgi:YVTN family beta-propeller protein